MSTIFDGMITREQFIDRYEKEKTRAAVKSSLRAFDVYREKSHPGIDEQKYFDEMKKLDDQRLYMELDRMVQVWKNTLSPKSVQLYFTFTRAWFRVNGIRTFDDLVKVYVKMPKVLKEKSATMTHHIALKFHNALLPKYAIYFDFCCYSGVRLDNEGLGIEVRDVSLNEDPIRIRIRPETAKTGVERTTFVPISMRADLARMMGAKKPTEKVFDFCYSAYYKHFCHVRAKLGLVDKKQNGRNYQIVPYKSRKYAKTNISRATDSDFSENILGHANGVKGTYYEVEDADLGVIYNKAVPFLSLNKEQVYKDQLEKAQEKLADVDDLKLTLQKQQDEIKRMQDVLKNKKLK